MLNCDCGSGLIPEAVHDGHGIYLFRACPRCKASKLSHYRADIMERYEADEEIEAEEY